MSMYLAAPDYVGELGDGLIARWSTIADRTNIGQLLGHVFRENADEPSNTRLADAANITMRADFPFMEPGDFALIEDRRKAGNPLVACTCLLRHQWQYDDIPFGVGRPEYVASDPDYRHRGLIRRVFDMVHARSAAKGHLMQAITGIPYFYRQFGYEYVLDLGGQRIVYTSAIPPKKDDAPEPYALRAATFADIPHLMALYEQGRHRGSLLWHNASAAYFEFLIGFWLDPSRARAILHRYRLALGNADDCRCER